jgi:hypothetical protein
MDNEFKDMEVECKECKIVFIVTAGEQEFLNKCFLEQSENPINHSVIKEVSYPKRCKECRNKRKAFFATHK